MTWSALSAEIAVEMRAHEDHERAELAAAIEAHLYPYWHVPDPRVVAKQRAEVQRTYRAKPDAREKQNAWQRARFAALTPEQREKHNATCREAMRRLAERRRREKGSAP
jgi:hypothetical protein